MVVFAGNQRNSKEPLCRRVSSRMRISIRKVKVLESSFKGTSYYPPCPISYTVYVILLFRVLPCRGNGPEQEGRRCSQGLLGSAMRSAHSGHLNRAWGRGRWTSSWTTLGICLASCSPSEYLSKSTDLSSSFPRTSLRVFFSNRQTASFANQRVLLAVTTVRCWQQKQN